METSLEAETSQLLFHSLFDPFCTQWDGGSFDGAGVPACFVVNTLNQYRTYSGNSPWTNAPTDAGELPNETTGHLGKYHQKSPQNYQF